MDLSRILTYAAIGIAIALVVFGLLIVANKNDRRTKALKIVVAVMVGFVIAFSLATHQSVIERNRELAKLHAQIHGIGNEQTTSHGSETGFIGKSEQSAPVQQQQGDGNEEEEQQQGDGGDEEEEEDEDEEKEEDKEAACKDVEQAEMEAAEAHDAGKLWQKPDWKYAGHASQSKVAERKVVRNARAGVDYLNRNESHPLAVLLGNMVTHDGMRPVQDSTLYARESYRTHQVNEYGEGMDQRYVDPSLKTYDLSFAAYGKQRIIKPRVLSVNAPMHF